MPTERWGYVEVLVNGRVIDRSVVKSLADAYRDAQAVRDQAVEYGYEAEARVIERTY